MANRVIQAKILKMKKQRLKSPKSPVRVGPRPNINVLREYRERARSLEQNEAEIDKWIKVLYGRNPFVGVPPERKRVLDLIVQLQEKGMEYLSFSLMDNPTQSCRCYFNSQRNCVILVHTNNNSGVIRQSIEYGSIERAIHQWEAYKVRWKPFAPSQPNSA